MGHNFGGEPRLVMAAAGVGWINGFLAGFILLSVVLVAVLSVTGALAVWGAIAASAGLGAIGGFIWSILPRRFEIYDDRLVIVFGFWRWNIAMGSIELAREARAWQSYAYNGLRLASAPGRSVELRRINSNLFTRPNMIFSPADRTIFLTELNTALARHRRLHGTDGRQG